MAYAYITVENRGPVGLLTLARPKALNALNTAMIGEICEAIAAFEADAKTDVVVMTGSDRAFAAGADIKEMAEMGFVEAFAANHAAGLDCVAQARKPLIAAVAGYCLGGGCELAMACDFIIAADNAKFGQPEITLGIIPGMGGTQRLSRVVGRAKAMDLILTGRTMDAREAESSGLVARVVDPDDLMETAMEAAARIAEMSRPSVMMAKEAIAAAEETPLSQGLQLERRLFHALFATEDQKEGMAAFLEKRTPQFKNR